MHGHVAKPSGIASKEACKITIEPDERISGRLQMKPVSSGVKNTGGCFYFVKLCRATVLMQSEGISGRGQLQF